MRLCRKRTGKNEETQRNKFFAERWEYGILYPRIYLKKETKKRNKQLKEMNKTIQDLKTEVEAIKKTQTKRVLEMKN